MYKKNIVLFSFIFITLLSIYAAYIYITTYLTRNDFFYFGFIFLFLLIALIITYVIMYKIDITGKIVKVIFFITVMLDTILFLIYSVHIFKYLYWVIGISAE
ncbi:MAG: hypothetical protein ACM34O_07035 [Ignavibacteria bacterium]